jgi:putative membrane protein (TIGR04086 family)
MYKFLSDYKENKGHLMPYVKAILISLAISLVGVLFFAVILKFVDINTTWILTINQVIKIISILIAFFFIRKKVKLNWWKGLIFGLIYALITFLIFSLLSGSFSFDTNLLHNIIFSSIIGMICAIIVRL